MRSITKLAAIAAVAFLVLPPALAAPRTKEDQQKYAMAARKFIEGKKLYRSGQYAAGRAKIDTGVAEILAIENKYEDPRANGKMTEQEMSEGIGGISPGGIANLNIFAKFYIGIGCYEKVASLMERNIRSVKRYSINVDQLYRQSLRIYGQVLRRMGKTQKAITIQLELIGDYDKQVKLMGEHKTPDGNAARHEVAWLASLYHDAGNIDKNRQIMAEVRKAYERLWEKTSQGASRATDETYLLVMEGRYKEVEKMLRRALATELKKTETDRNAIGKIYWRLAQVHNLSGAADKYLEAIKKWHEYHGPPRRKYLPQRYLIIAKAYKKAGRHAAAKKLADEYRLCLN